MLKYLEFMIGGFGDFGVKLSIHVKNERIICTGGSPFWDDEQFQTIHLTMKQSEKVLEKIANLQISKWKSYYSPEGYIVMDGTQWELEYKEDEKRCRHIHGDNVYPDNWNAFIFLLDELLPQAGLVDENQIDSLRIEFNYKYEIEEPYYYKKKYKHETKEILSVDAKNQNISYIKEHNDGSRYNQECHLPEWDASIFSTIDDHADTFDEMTDEKERSSLPMITIEYKKHAFPVRKVRIPYCRWTLPEGWNDFIMDVQKELKDVIIPGELFNKTYIMFGKKEDEIIYLSTEFQTGGRTYYYKTEDDTIRPGDEVIVPVGNDGDEKKVKVKKIEYYLHENTPFPEDRTRAVLRKSLKDEEEYCEIKRKEIKDNPIPPLEEFDDDFIDDNLESIALCPRKEVNLILVKDSLNEVVEYIFTVMTEWLEDIECNQREFDSLCKLFGVSKEDYVEGWKHFFEWESVYLFVKGYEIIREDNGYYYAYGYLAEEKSADAIYRFKDDKFERYYPKDGIWREVPEERMILKERKARYTHLKEEEAMGLLLLG